MSTIMPSSADENEMHYRPIVTRVIGRIWWILVGGIVGLAIAIVISIYSPKKYRVEVVLAYQPSQSGAGQLGPLSGQLGALSSFVGLNVGQDSSNAIALATLKGHRFTAEFIRDYGLLQKLFADRWDPIQRKWKGRPPTLDQAVNAFDRGGIRKILDDRQTGLITMQIEWRNPSEAETWLNALVERVNAELRRKAIADAGRSLKYLSDELNRESVLELRQAISRLMEIQLNQIMLANVRDDYAFRVVDAPLLPDQRDYIWPRRVLMGAVGLLMGGAIAVVLAAILPFPLRRRPTHQIAGTRI